MHSIGHKLTLFVQICHGQAGTNTCWSIRLRVHMAHILMRYWNHCSVPVSVVIHSIGHPVYSKFLNGYNTHYWRIISKNSGKSVVKKIQF